MARLIEGRKFRTTHVAASGPVWPWCLGLVLLGGCFGPAIVPVSDKTRSERPPAAVVQPQRVPQSVALDRHTVQPGDTLYSIAFAAGRDYREVAAWNGISPPYLIRVGQVLTLRRPAAGKPPRPEAVRSRPAAPEPSSAPLPGPAGAASVAPEWVWPAEGRVSRRFAPASGRNGIEISGRQGGSVRASAGGRVVYSGSGLRGYGRLVIVKHDDVFLTAYAHNAEVVVGEGDRVVSGQKIAEMGAAEGGSGRLHFEIRRRGKPVDPMRFLPRK